MNKDTALRLALEALESGEKMQNGRLVWIEHDTSLVKQAITAVKAALEAKDEPVAWYLQDLNQRGVSLKKETQEWKPFYTIPPQRTWVGLTDEEFKDAINDKLTPECIAIAIEAKLKEKNT
jgi:hypothetical protein